MSENYQVSARKYRPSTFNSVVGQNHISLTLKKAVATGHLAQAYLFTGPRGVGKTTCARILAKAINCENPASDGEPCNICHSCMMFNEQRTLNVYELDAASNNSVDDIRALVDQVRFPPQSGKYKVYIIDEVHMLSANAFNAFLKTLEEPPSYAVFILATTEKQKIIPTILSRCQIYDFSRIRVKDMLLHLKQIAKNEGVDAEETALHVIALKADGALRDALTIFDRLISFSGNKLTYNDVISNLNIIDYDYFFRITDHILNGETGPCILLFNEIIQSGFDGLNLLTGLEEHFRDLFVCKNPETVVLLEQSDVVASRYAEQAQRANTSLVLSCMNLIHQFIISYKESKNQRLHVELALIKLCHMPDALDFAGMAREQKKNLSQADDKPASQYQESRPDLFNQHKTSANGLSSASLLKLNSYKEKVIEEENVREELDEISETFNGEVVEIDRGRFRMAWDNYLTEKVKGKKINLYNCLTAINPEFTGPNTVRLVFENSVLSALFQTERQELTDFMHSHYQLVGVHFDIMVKETEDEESKGKYLVTPKEKYSHMVSINPELDNLRRTLGLRLDG